MLCYMYRNLLLQLVGLALVLILQMRITMPTCVRVMLTFYTSELFYSYNLY